MSFPDIVDWANWRKDIKVAHGHCCNLTFKFEKDCKAIDIWNRPVYFELLDKITGDTKYSFGFPQTQTFPVAWFDVRIERGDLIDTENGIVTFPLFCLVTQPNWESDYTDMWVQAGDCCCYKVRLRNTWPNPNYLQRFLACYWEICFVDVGKC